MCKGTSKSSIHQEKTLFSLPEIVSDKKITRIFLEKVCGFGKSRYLCKR